MEDTWEVRACTADDLGTVLAMVRADEERVTGRPCRLVAGDIRDWWQAVDLATGSWLFTAPGSPDPAGVVWLQPEGDLGFSLPFADRSRPAVFTALVDRVERRAAELGLARLHLAVLVPDPLAEEVLGGRGYRSVRRFYEMAVELDGPVTTSPLPDGLTLQPVTQDRVRDVHAVLSEAFRDHWEHHELPFDEWWQQRGSDPDVDLGWWFVVQDGDEPVAAARNIPGRNGGVYVASLGVRRPWRGRGLAKALLRHTFARAWEAGMPRVTLGVDATSPTGATQLYRSVGMVVELESEVWERHLPTS